MENTADNNNHNTRNSQEKIIPDELISGNELTPFRRKGLADELKSARKINRKSLINILNHIHFMGGSFSARIQYSLTKENFLLKVQVEPCQENLVRVYVPLISPVNLENYDFFDLIIDDGKSVVLVPVETITKDKHSVMVRIPQKGFILGHRKSRRLRCSNIHAEITDAKFNTPGSLIDFSFNSLRILIDNNQLSPQEFFGKGSSKKITLKDGQKKIFSGEGRLLHIEKKTQGTEIIIELANEPNVLFKRRKLRHPRVKLVPAPKISLIHPLSNKKVTYEINDIGTTGFSVEETQDEALLIPGMLFSDITFLFPGGFKLSCAAQIVYSQPRRGKKVHHGFFISDMDTTSYCRLFDIVSKAHDPGCNMTSEIDMNNLWEFFFKSGFIYPRKYESVSQYKEKFKEIYRKLYLECQEIFTSITYQNNGKIYGHNCAIKAYQRAWMIYHLAATSKGARQIGLDILRQSHDFFDGMCRLPSLGMDYMVIFYRPNNKFPDYFFGGFCREYKNPKACSMDTFAYLHYSLLREKKKLPDGWSLTACNKKDHDHLREFYEKTSGGLMLEMFGLDKTFSEESIEDVYSRLGLIRTCNAFALRYNDNMRAVLIVDQSDMGTNLSELLNNIKIIVVEKDDLDWVILENAIAQLGQEYSRENIPVMIYPFEYVQSVGVRYEKKYNLWIVNSLFGDDYVDFIKRLLKFNTFKFLKYLVKKSIQR